MNSGADALVVAVVGAGIMGIGIAQVSAMAGDTAAVQDAHRAALQRAEATINTSLGRLVRGGRTSSEMAAAAVNRIRFSTNLADASVVVEAVPEQLELKHEVWGSIAALAPADRTDPEVLNRARTFASSLGKEVVVCRKDSPGFVTSRAYAILRLECIRMLEEGVASAADIDTALKRGFNFPMGPLELGDMNGLDTFLNAVNGLAEAHGERFRPTVGLKNMVAAGRLGRKTGIGFYDYSDDGEGTE